MTLEGVLDREHHVARESDAVTREVPVGVLVVDDHEGGLIGGGEFAYAFVASTFKPMKPS